MTRFLRFEIGGASTLLWMLLFLAPVLNITELTKVDATKLFSAVFGSVILAIPLGNYIHQVSDSLFNPFRARRLLFWPRAVVQEIASSLGASAAQFSDGTFQAILVFSKATLRTRKLGGDSRNLELKFDAEILREEISNRYSYYYARIENGLVAPVLGYVFAVLVVHEFSGANYFRDPPSFSIVWIVAAACVVGGAMLWHIPRLFCELDDLEVALVRLQRDSWPLRDFERARKTTKVPVIVLSVIVIALCLAALWCALSRAL